MVPHAVKWIVLSLAVGTTTAAAADEYDATLDQPRFSTQGRYTTHAPDLVVPGRFHAGPCVGGAHVQAEGGADYVPGVDSRGNPVVPAELSPHDAFHWSGPSFQYLFQRAPSAREAQLGLEPRDYVVVDAGDGTVYFNGHRLSGARDVPPPPGLCD
jgi:hypothetical protein